MVSPGSRAPGIGSGDPQGSRGYWVRDRVGLDSENELGL